MSQLDRATDVRGALAIVGSQGDKAGIFVEPIDPSTADWGVPTGCLLLNPNTGAAYRKTAASTTAWTEIGEGAQGIYDTSTSESVVTASYSGIRQLTAGITTTLTGGADGQRLRVHNASGGACFVSATINGEAGSQIIYDRETFDLEYHATQGEWVI